MPITYILIGITVVISFYAFSRADVLNKLMMNPYSISKRDQYYRFITSGFIHGDHMHLIMNMLSLYFFGPVVEQIFAAVFGDLGTIYFLALYFMAIVVSDLPTFFKHKNNPGYNSLGASGGVAAIIFAFIIFAPLEKICLYFALCMPGFILGTLYVVFSYYQGKKANDNINHSAHLFGALFGMVFCIVLYPEVLPHFIEQIAAWSPSFF
ncbi:MAG TPA: rhomboid family intramembrane serine protease [Ohtaekwangia sp.]